jgi:competence protein ComEC
MMRDIFRRGRLLICASAAALGGVVGGGCGLPIFWVFFLGGGLLLGAALARRKGNVAVILIACLLFMAGGFYLGQARCSRWRGREGPAGEVCLLGRIEVGCRGEPGEEAVIYRVEEVIEGDTARPGDGYLLRSERGSTALPRWGEELEVRGSLFIFDRERGGVGGCLQAGEIKHLTSSSNPLLRLAMAFREELRERCERCLEPEAAGLIEGMVLGDYRRLKAQDLIDLRSSGLIHLCAASGLHLGILVVLILWLGKRLLLSRKVLLAIQAPLLMTYALAVGLTIPVQRATVVALVASAAYLAARDFDFTAALGVAVLYLVIRDPIVAMSTSFQLSFAAALGVALLHAALSRGIGPIDSRMNHLLAATLAAQLAVAPLLLYHFGEVSLLAVLGNLLVLPLIPLIMALSMLSTLLGLLHLPMADLPLRAAAPAASWVLAVARTLSAASWSLLFMAPFPAGWIAVYYPALAAACLGGGRWRRLGRTVLVVLICMALLAGGTFPVISSRRGTGMRVTFIDVGQGDAVLVQAPSGAAVLVDGGEDERALAADLRSRGVRYLDVIVVSHPEEDHVGGLEGAMDVCGVGMLVHPGTEGGEAAEELFVRAVEEGIAIETMRRGESLSLGELELQALAPLVDLPDDISANDGSLVMRVEGPGLSLLLTGDVEEAGEEALLRYPEELHGEILKVPHHGGFCEENEAFFRVIDPDVAVVCVGENNSYGHPSKSTVDALERVGCSVYRTDLCGDIVVHVVDGGYKIECER